ncbi:MAG: hypothetical protein KGP29_03445 [Proteobacteria bacterium]|nr:hypothetical protein [Pseudomonadota bacterium]
MFKNLLIIAAFFLLNSCIFLSRSDIVKQDESKAIAIFSLEVIYDGKPETRHRGIAGFCQVRFHNNEFEDVKFRSEKNSKFYFLKEAPGKITLNKMNCMHHVVPLLYLKNRSVDLSNWAFMAHPGFINYAGHITVSYRPAGFGARDLFGLGGLRYDLQGRVDVRIEDKIDDAISFMRLNYPELANIPVTKSLLEDIADLKHNKKAEIYNASAQIKQSSPTITPTIQPAPLPQNFNPYLNNSYDPYQHPQSVMPYYNPYQNQGPEAPQSGN